MRELHRQTGAPLELIARELGMEPDSVRRRDPLAAGEEVWAAQVERAWTLGPGARLPHVHEDGDETPDHGWVNLPLKAQRRSREALRVELRALQVLHTLTDGRAGNPGPAILLAA